MRLTIFLFLSIFAQPSISNAQDCDDPHCKTLLSKLKEISKLNKTIEDERVELRKSNATLQTEKAQGMRNQQEINRLQEIYNQQNERINQLVSDLNTKQREYNDKLEETKTLISQNSGLRKNNQDLVKFVDDLEAEKESYEDKDNMYISKSNDLDIRNFMDTWINDIELGYEKDGKIVVYKVYDGEKIDFRNAAIFGKNLNRLNLKGDWYINKKVGVTPKPEIKGKILIYSDHKLLEIVDNSMELVVEDDYDTYSHYTIKFSRGNILNTKVNEKASALIRVAFVDNEKYSSTDKSEYNNFWDAKNKGLLTMTTIKPKFPNVKLTDTETLKNALLIGTCKTTYDNITLEIFDYGKFDGDQASFYLNGEPLITYLNLGKREKPFVKENVQLRKGKNYLTIMANNTGTVEPCTAAVNFKDSNGNTLKSIKLSAKVGYCEKFEIVR